MGSCQIAGFNINGIDFTGCYQDISQVKGLYQQQQLGLQPDIFTS